MDGGGPEEVVQLKTTKVYPEHTKGNRVMGKIIAGVVLLIPFFLAPAGNVRGIAALIGMVGIILIIFGLSPRRKDTGSEYKKAIVGSETKFDVTPARIPFPIGGLIFVVVACAPAVLFFSFGLNLPAAGILFALIGIAVFLFIWKGGPAGKYRQSATFLVGPDGVTVSGGKLQATDIHRLILRNHVDGSQFVGPSFQGPVAAYDMGTATGAVAGSAHALMVGMAMTGDALRRRRKNRIRLIAYRLDAEAGGKATTLACGMDETTAYGLMTDVANILGMR